MEQNHSTPPAEKHGRDVYETSLMLKQAEFEAICRRCGACCGANDGDPCARLRAEENGLYRCTGYESRLGPQETVSGQFFTCVDIREHIKAGTLRHGCSYRG